VSANLRLGGGGEFDRLRRIFARLGGTGQSLGDDCALVRVGRDWLAVSIDLSLEGVHFRTDWLSFREIGWRSAAAALSDLPIPALSCANALMLSTTARPKTKTSNFFILLS